MACVVDVEYPLPPQKPLKVLIVGCGITGLTTALGLKLFGHEVTVFEQSVALAEAGAGIQLAPNASRILRLFGVLEEVMSKANILAQNSLRRYQDDQELGKAPLMPLEKYHAPLAVIHRADLVDILVRRVRELGVRIRLNTKVQAVDSEFEARIQLHTQEWVLGDVVIACDGIHSSSRKQMMNYQGARAGYISTGDAAYRLLIPAEAMESNPVTFGLIHHNVGIRWMGPGGHIMAYPIKRNTLYNMVLVHPQTGDWSEGEETWTRMGSKRQMQHIYQGWNRVVQTLVDLVPEKEIVEWSLYIHPHLPRWFQNKCVLAGDACHPMLPYVAQGAAQGIEDAAVLTLCLSLPLDIWTALMVYEHHRKTRAERIQDSATATGEILHLPDGEAQRRRDEAFRGHGRNPDLWADSKWQDYMWGTDVIKDVSEHWEDTVAQVRGRTK
ncbi:salicylate hydroxylase [Aspergillus alliaceus]|uniref:salicylate hydroxylase n=1 Tax=Petromyces alliaceus TaxID=209559 RepID=UPI0012A733A2|nr:salicylate hydroxylase [Aspergillus alliaceus]KAB8226870.1 salicylate hydroxylase [Aspergillus alliaceus]